MDTIELHKATPPLPAKSKNRLGTSTTFFFVGFAAFVIGMALQQGVVGGVGFAVMAISVVFMNTALWARVVNSKSVRYFRSISTVLRRYVEDEAKQ